MKTQSLLSAMFVCLAFASMAGAAEPVSAPEPYGALPSERQLEWHNKEFYGFLHFTTNTFTDKEWGYGDESPEVFNPTDFDADQIVSVAKAAGMKGLILTCKHHDGFCLWPSKYTEHSVKHSPWKDGKGDVVREISDACQRHGIAFGVYLSPWDRNYAGYGKPEYIEYYRHQMKELLTNYGEVFEVWLDGANGGDGYYGGTRETRRIDRSTYYDWPNTIELVRQLQPKAMIFSDAGPDVRWIGNEQGFANETCWATYTPHVNGDEKIAGPGTTIYQEGTTGHADGEFWMPGEADVSIRPGWFYHASQDDKVRSADNLMDLYFKSVGRGSSFLLNLPPDRRGLIHENDQASLSKFREQLDALFANNLATKAEITASNTRGDSEQFATKHLVDGDRETYWATDDDSTEASLILEFSEPATFHIVDLREYLPLGQRVRSWKLEQWQDGQWQEFAAGKSIGNRRLWRGDEITTSKVRITVDGPVCPALSEVGLYQL
ncbi:alpha-L-fucosidase [Aeoliella mucimassa]|uniref:alpha-L-fucosidase n=1 Tax=Aeoliella mucimassa TaxID=2527972 RepID=A0A518ASN3_9BACT|nr:alpha-L-fucosidase [Aeoliella mucimassa]QDU57730.1 Alpha-L-fucosidase [Aeoliella mucimassa]